MTYQTNQAMASDRDLSDKIYKYKLCHIRNQIYDNISTCMAFVNIMVLIPCLSHKIILLSLIQYPLPHLHLTRPNQGKPNPERKPKQHQTVANPLPACHHAVPGPRGSSQWSPRHLPPVQPHHSVIPHPCHTTPLSCTKPFPYHCIPPCAIKYINNYPVKYRILQYQSIPPKAYQTIAHYTSPTKPNQTKPNQTRNINAFQPPINYFHRTTLDTRCHVAHFVPFCTLAPVSFVQCNRRPEYSTRCPGRR